MIWEARLDRSQRPSANATRDQRLAFITAKYAQRAYVEPVVHSADETLLTSIKKNNLQNVYHALALTANPNAADRSRGTHAVFLALAAADPAAPGGPATSIQVDLSQPRKSFPMAELLMQNGADIPNLPAPIPLSKAATAYIEFKKAQRQGKIIANGSTSISNEGGAAAAAAAPPSSYPALMVHHSDRKESKLSKRSSAGHHLSNKLAKGAGAPS